MNMTISEILSDIQSGKQTAEAVTRACLAKIAELNPTINALVEVWAEDALKQAQAVDAKKARGEKLGALAGVPFTVGSDSRETLGSSILYYTRRETLCSSS